MTDDTLDICSCGHCRREHDNKQCNWVGNRCDDCNCTDFELYNTMDNYLNNIEYDDCPAWEDIDDANKSEDHCQVCGTDKEVVDYGVGDLTEEEIMAVCIPCYRQAFIDSQKTVEVT